jgi:hypothetical protein
MAGNRLRMLHADSDESCERHRLLPFGTTAPLFRTPAATSLDDPA